MLKSTLMLAAGILLAFAASGCQTDQNAWKNLQATTQPKPKKTERAKLPPHVAGTVGEYAVITGGTEMMVQGYGLVVGLGTNGSAEVPAHLREYYVQYLLRNKVMSTKAGTAELSPKMILDDLDTAVVDVWGIIPPGAPAGTKFDIFISAMAETQTKNLDGGVLMPTDLHMAVSSTVMASKRSRVWAEGAGTAFVNPFLDPKNGDDVPRFRQARIIGGGKVLEDRPIRLQLYQGDFEICTLVQNRINERFPTKEKIAKARDDSSIEIVIPREYARDYERFIQLVIHLPLRQTQGGWETKAREIADAMESSGANYDELALVWEAIGNQVLPIVQKLYYSPNQFAAFYAARCGLRLGDSRGGEVVMRFARTKDSQLQVRAIEELGNSGKAGVASVVLQGLLNDDNEMVRIAAYEALRRLGDRSKISRITIKGQFEVDIVDSNKTPVIYALQSMDQRLVLFGRNLAVQRPIFYNSPDDLLTVSAKGSNDKLAVFRKIQRTGGFSQTFQIEPSLMKFIELLGALPEKDKFANVYGLGFTYGQVVATLQRMCKSGDIQAEFRLQALPEMQKIYRSSVTTGRPDMPGS